MLVSEKISYYRWPVGIATFFLVLFVFEFNLLRKAISSRPGLIVDNPYQHSLNYQDTIDKLGRAARQAVKFSFLVGPAGASGDREVVILCSPKRVAQTVSLIDVKFKRPESSTLDFSAQFKPSLIKEDSFESKITLPKKGLWLVESEFEFNGSKMLIQDRITVN